MATTVQAYVGPLPAVSSAAYPSTSMGGSSFNIAPSAVNLSALPGLVISAPGANTTVTETNAYFPTISASTTVQEPRAIAAGGGTSPGGGGDAAPTQGQLYPLGRN